MGDNDQDLVTIISSKVLSVLDAVHMLFSDEGSPFIILLAIDPHVITKAIELNIHHVSISLNPL